MSARPHDTVELPPAPATSAARPETTTRDLEAKLIEQEHRWIPAILNALDAWRYWPESDLRRRAAFRAVVWRLFSPATLAAAGLSITALASLLVALYSTVLLEQQNRKLDQQTFLAEAARSAALVSELGAVTGLLSDFTASACVSKGQRRQCWPDVGFRERAGWMAEYELAAKGNDSLARIMRDPLRQVRDVRYIQLTLPSDLQGRIVALSNGLRPYRFLVNDNADAAPARADSLPRRMASRLGLLVEPVDAPRLSRAALSIERGILLDVLTRSNVDVTGGIISAADFRQSAFRDKDLIRQQLSTIRLDRSDLTCTNFQEAVLVSASFRGAVLRHASFKMADLDSATFHDADLTDAILSGAKVPAAGGFHGANLTRTDIEGAEVPTPAWLEELSLQGVRGLDPAAWEVRKTRDRGGTFHIARASATTSISAEDPPCSPKALPLEAGDPYDYTPR